MIPDTHKFLQEISIRKKFSNKHIDKNGSPESLGWADDTFNIHSSEPSGWMAWKRWSLVYVIMPIVIMCKSCLRIHETCNVKGVQIMVNWKQLRGFSIKLETYVWNQLSCIVMDRRHGEQHNQVRWPNMTLYIDKFGVMKFRKCKLSTV